jgi:hypothetical protein
MIHAILHFQSSIFLQENGEWKMTKAHYED